ncbi:MAG: SAM-dependent DNA methyltransferase, partial [Patescibacteria group bacterium]|nr:SAM-dependent DNA methyltransferase [Patescibacteria group bacterium]
FFTPPGLARSLTEVCLERFVDRDELTIADYACGSGVFLTEAIRALVRRGFHGKLTVIGRDVSLTAIAAARFALGCAKIDSPTLDLVVHLTVADALADGPLEPADVVLMNPPFRSWEAMSPEEKARLKAVLGPLYKGRADLCMAIARKAFDAVKQGGCFGSLLPVGVLASESAVAWRDYFASNGRLRNLAALGDHSLFRYATVNMGMVVIDKTDTTALIKPVTMIWADESVDAASSALRNLRKKLNGDKYDVSPRRSWCIYTLDSSEIARRHTWLPRPNALSRLIGEIRQRNPSTLGELFELRQGARAGLRRAFILSKEQLAELPEGERAGFRPVAENDTLRRGHILQGRFAFYPPARITSEEELAEKYPQYMERFLSPNRPELSKRAGTQEWWEMTWDRRSWHGNPRPKIITPMFASPQSFALDEQGNHVVCQGWAWMPRRAAQERSPRDDDALRSLKLYCALFNTDFFFQMVREFSTNMAGGQIDMSPKFISAIPCPSWSEIAERLLSVPNVDVVESRPPYDEAISTAYTMREDVALRLYGMSPETNLGGSDA